MNVEALNDFYSVSKENGYEGGINDYVKDLQTNPDFFQSEYDNSLNYGYEDSIDDFANIVGVPSEDIKKKNSDLNLPSEDGLSSSDSTPIETALPISSDLDIQDNQYFQQPINEQQPEQNIPVQESSYTIPRNISKDFQVETNEMASSLGLNKPVTDTIQNKSVDILAGAPELKQKTVKEARDINDVTVNGIKINRNFVWLKEDQEDADKRFKILNDVYGKAEYKKYNPAEYYTTNTDIGSSLGKTLFGAELSKKDYDTWAAQQVNEGNAEYVYTEGTPEKGNRFSFGTYKLDENGSRIVRPTEKGLALFNSQIDEMNKKMQEQIEKENTSASYTNLGKLVHPIEIPKTPMQELSANYYDATGELLPQDKIDSLTTPEAIQEIQNEIDAHNMVKASNGTLQYDQALINVQNSKNIPDSVRSKNTRDVFGNFLRAIKINSGKPKQFYSKYGDEVVADPDEIKLYKNLFSNPNSALALKFGQWWETQGKKEFGSTSSHYFEKMSLSQNDRRRLVKSFLNYTSDNPSIQQEALQNAIDVNRKKMTEALNKKDVTSANSIIDNLNNLYKQKKIIDQQVSDDENISKKINAVYKTPLINEAQQAEFTAKLESHNPLAVGENILAQLTYGVGGAVKDTGLGIARFLTSWAGNDYINDELRYESEPRENLGIIKQNNITAQVKKYEDSKGNKYEEIDGQLFNVKDGNYSFIKSPDYSKLTLKGDTETVSFGGFAKHIAGFGTTVALADGMGGIVNKTVGNGLEWLASTIGARKNMATLNGIAEEIASTRGISKELAKDTWTYQRAANAASMAEGVFGEQSLITQNLRKTAQFLNTSKAQNAVGFYIQSSNNNYMAGYNAGLRGDLELNANMNLQNFLMASMMYVQPTERLFGQMNSESRQIVNSLLKGEINSAKKFTSNLANIIYESSIQGAKFTGEMKSMGFASDVVNYVFNKTSGSKFEVFKTPNFNETLVADFLTPFAMNMIGAIGGMRGVKEFSEMSEPEMLAMLARDPDILNKLSNHKKDYVYHGEATKILDDKIKEIATIQRNRGKIPNPDAYSDLAVYNASTLLTSLDKKNSELERVAEPFKDKIREEIKSIKENINKILDADLVGEKPEKLNPKDFAKKKEVKPETTKENAVQEQTTNESVLGAEQSKVELQEIERRRQEELNSLGQKQIKLGFDKLNKASSANEKADAIASIENNKNKGALLSEEQNADLEKAKKDLNEEGYELRLPDVLVNGEKYISENTVEYDGRVLTENQANVIEKTFDRLEKRGEEIDNNEIPVLVNKTFKPFVFKDGKMSQAAHVETMVFLSAEQAREAIRKSKELGYKKETISDKINAKYDAELEALRNKQKETITPEGKEEVTPELTLEDALNLDTNETSNFDRVISFLDNAITKLDSFEKETLGINIPVVLAKKVFEAVKVTFKATKNLSEAIKKVANEFKLSEKDVEDSLAYFSKPKGKKTDEEIVNEYRNKGFSDESIKVLFSKQGMSEERIDKALSNEAPKTKLEGREALMSEIKTSSETIKNNKENIIAEAKEKIKEKYAKNKKSITDTKLNEYAEKEYKKQLDSDTTKKLFDSEVYKSASDAEKKELEIEAANAISERENRNISRGRIKEVVPTGTPLSASEKNAIVSKIKSLNQEGLQKLSKEVEALRKNGNISAKQMSVILKKFADANTFGKASMDKLADYVDKVLTKADYVDQLSIANKTKDSIKKASKNKSKDVNITTLGKKFSKINPELVSDISEYQQKANEMKDALRGSVVKGEEFTLKNTVAINEFNKWVDSELARQDEIRYNDLVEKVEDIIGTRPEGLSVKELESIISESKPTNEFDVEKLKKEFKNTFDLMSMIAKKSIESGKDPFTGEKIEMSSHQKKMAEDFIKIDTNKFYDSNSKLIQGYAREASIALRELLVNGSTARMGSILSAYKGLENAEMIDGKGIESKDIKIYFSYNLGEAAAKYLYSDVLLFAKAFNSEKVGHEVERAMGGVGIKNGTATAETVTEGFVGGYARDLYNKKANAQKYNTAFNDYERGMFAELYKVPENITTEEGIQKQFDNKKEEIEETIRILSSGSREEQEKAKIQKQVYDKILKGANNIEDVRARTSKENVEGVDHWVNEIYGRVYDDFKNHVEAYHNRILGNDLNFTATRYKLLSGETPSETVDDSNILEQSAYINNNNLDKREAKSFKSKVEHGKMPKNMYLDLSFDMKNANALKDMMLDRYTADAVRQASSFISSKEFKDIFPQAEVRELIKNRFIFISKTIRGAHPFSENNFKKLDRLGKASAAITLGGLKQFPMQTIPIMFNTWANGANIDFSFYKDPAKLRLINESGRTIANRGVQAQSDIESINRLIEKAANSKGEAAIRLLEHAQEFWIRSFLEKPDVWIAKASWLGYYEKSLKDQYKKGEISKEDAEDIDYSKHKLNEKAADYADSQIDKNQNTSMSQFQGEFLASQGAGAKMVKKMLFSFANFRINTSARIGVSWSILQSKTATIEDRKDAARTLTSSLAELAAFRILQGVFSVGFTALAQGTLDRKNSEKTWKQIIMDEVKRQATSGGIDLFSPIPNLDDVIQFGIYNGLNFAQQAAGVKEDERVNIAKPFEKGVLSPFGLLGIATQRSIDYLQLLYSSITGKYVDNQGKDARISKEDQDVLKKMRWLDAPAALGLLPSDVHSYTKKVYSTSKGEYKTPEQIQREEEAKAISDKEKEDKAKVFDIINKKYYNKPEMLKALDNKKIEFEGEDNENYDAFKKDQEKEKELEYSLLYDPKKDIRYKNQDELKKYNLLLYFKNFGPSSKWHKDHKAEEKISDEINREMKKIKNLKYGFNKNYKLGRMKF